jgi:tRNA-dihydrouridine synthase 4
MVARGLLHNPGLFDDRRLGDPDVLTGKYNSIFKLVKMIIEWTKIALELGIPYSSYHKHLMYMLDKVTTRPETRVFNSLQSMLQAVSWLRERNYIYC